MDKKIKSFMKNMKILFKYYRPSLILLTFKAVLFAILPLISIYVSARIVNEIVGNLGKSNLTKWIVISLGMTFATKLIYEIFSAIGEFQASKSNIIYNKIFQDKFNSMDFKDIEDPNNLDEFNQILMTKNFVGKGLIYTLFNYEEIIKSLVTIILSSILTLSFFYKTVPATSSLQVLNSPALNLLFILGILTFTILMSIFNNSLDNLFNKLLTMGTLGNRMFGFYLFELTDRSRSLDTRIFRQDILAVDKFYKENIFKPGGVFDRELFSSSRKYNILVALISNLQVFLIYGFVLAKAYEGAFSIGLLTQYIGSISQFSLALATLINLFILIKNNIDYADKAINFLEKKSTIYSGSLTTEKRSDRNYQIEFKNVSFKYPNTDIWALKNVSIQFDLGKRLAIVGPNGSGKTTFIKLLIRLYDPQEGEILLNGINIKKYNYKDYLKIFSVVFQDFNLFAYPLGENIAGSKSYDEDRVLTALDDVGFTDRLKELPQGLKTYLYKDIDENGIDLSGGEAQKIAIARALYQDSPFIILDEPTAALDPLSEQEIYEKLGSIVKDRTAIFISHRLSSCKFSDSIIVFDKGEIIEKDSHSKLLSKNGKYKELWDAQAEYYV